MLHRPHLLQPGPARARQNAGAVPCCLHSAELCCNTGWLRGWRVFCVPEVRRAAGQAWQPRNDTPVRGSHLRARRRLQSAPNTVFPCHSQATLSVSYGVCFSSATIDVYQRHQLHWSMHLMPAATRAAVCVRGVRGVRRGEVAAAEERGQKEPHSARGAALLRRCAPSVASAVASSATAAQGALFKEACQQKVPYVHVQELSGACCPVAAQDKLCCVCAWLLL